MRPYLSIKHPARGLKLKGLLVSLWLGLACFGQAAPKPVGGPTCTELPADWLVSGFGNDVGRAGIVIEDFNGNGVPEIIVGGTYANPENNFWQVIEWDNTSYQQLYVNPPGEAITAIRALQGMDGERLLVTLFQSGALAVYDPVSFERRDLVQLDQLTLARELQTADLDQDGVDELVICGETDVLIYAGVAPYTLLKTYKGLSGQAMVVAQADQDPALEVVCHGLNGRGYVIDTVSDQIEWNYALGFGTKIAVGDIDGDGKDEVVGISQQSIQALDLDLHLEKWSFPINPDTVWIADTDGDGIDEVLYAGSTLFCVDGRTGALYWSFEGQQLARMAVADVDHDQHLEVIMGTDVSYTTDRLRIIGLPDLQDEWLDYGLVKDFELMTVADLDGDHRDELVTTSQRQIQVIDSQTHQVRKSAFSTTAFPNATDLQVADIEGDGFVEILITVEADGLFILNGQTLALKGHFWDHNRKYQSLAVANLDEDPQLEIAIGSGDTFATSAKVFVIDSVKGIMEWESQDIVHPNASVSRVLAVDLDGDGSLELIAQIARDLYVIDPVTHQIREELPITGKLYGAQNLDDDPAAELILGPGGYEVAIYDGATYQVQEARTFPDSIFAIDAVTLEDLDQDGQRDWFIYTNVNAALYGDSSEAKWATSICIDRATYLARPIGNFDGDTDMEVVIQNGVWLRFYDLPTCGIPQLQFHLPTWPERTVSELLTHLCQ